MYTCNVTVSVGSVSGFTRIILPFSCTYSLTPVLRFFTLGTLLWWPCRLFCNPRQFRVHSAFPISCSPTYRICRRARAFYALIVESLCSSRSEVYRSPTPEIRIRDYFISRHFTRILFSVNTSADTWDITLIFSAEVSPCLPQPMVLTILFGFPPSPHGHKVAMSSTSSSAYKAV